MKLELERPLCFIDLETTGLDVENDKIVEITICKIHPNGEREIKTKVFNPERPISPEATELHGHTNESVANEKPFHKYAKGMHSFIEGCDIAGYNSNTYDNPMLYFEFLRAGIEWDYKSVNLIDVCNIFKIKEPRTLAGAFKFYCDKVSENTHNSKDDILATVEVFESQLEKYELPTNLKDLAYLSNYDKEIIDIGGKFSKDDDGDLIFNFGAKNRGKKCTSDKGYLEWMISDKATFTADVKKIASDILESMKEEPVKQPTK
jgi:DNA polymerase-3 subunit epsilon